MTPTTFFILLATIALGVILILWGRRGKRLNKNPTCRDCRFDLTGIYPASITCPECGGGLNRRKAVRIGARRRRLVPIALGVVMVLLPGATLALATFAALTGQDLNDFKPVALLIWEGEHGGDTLVQAAGEQLMDRYDMGELSSDEIDQVWRAALRIQGNVARPWHTSWGDLIENSHISGALDDDSYDIFLRQVAVIDVSTRPRVRVGSSIPVSIRLVESRIGTGSMFTVVVALKRCTLDGQETKVISLLDTWNANSHQLLASFWVYGDKSQPWMNPNSDIQQQVIALQGVELDMPGEHTIELDIQINVMSQDPTRPGWSWSWRPKAEQWRNAPIDSFAVRTTAVESSVRLIELVTPGETEREQMATELMPTNVYVMDSGGFGSNLDMQLSFNTSNLPYDGAFSVVIEQEGKTWNAGPLVSKPYAIVDQPPYFWNPGSPTEVSVSARVRGLKRGPVTLRLTPDPELATHSVDIKQIYGEEIVIEGIEADWSNANMDRSGPGPIVSFLRALIGN